ncbi:MAG: hypothetical protein A2X32_06810 [Elusimicrobia bacterium GWC2_64_44]|nr:MAG: hypothetical protein A2X32_06810 [Elusimicrobia bacterium GWC2_64_44]
MKKTRGEPFLFWALAALAAGAAAWLVFGQRAYSVQNFEFYADRGESLFHAVRSKAVSYSMPLLSLLVSAARYHLGLEPGLLAKAAGALIALPAFAIGARGGGRARGALFALAALAAGLGGGTIEAEQVIYSLSVMVFLSLELQRQASGGTALAAASGLAAGLTLLVRSPLFAFPVLAAGFQFFSLKPGLKRWLPATALFLACSLVLLLPWVRLNHSLFGRLILFEEERSTCNIITGASGVIYTIEGDARAFAGLSRTESPYPWAFRKILSSPLNYAEAVVKRLVQTFLLLWPLFLLSAAGFFFWRGAEARFLAFFCGYFVLLHCLLSIEERYFYPLKFPLALLAAGGAWELLKKRLPAAATAWCDRVTLPLLAALLLPAAGALAIVWRYPGAAKPALIAVEEALKDHPADPWLHKKKGELLLSFDLAEAGRAALREACAAGGGADLCCLTAALESAAPQLCPGSESLYELLLVKTLRELELGNYAEAEKTFALTRTHWLEERNGIKAMPYESDRKHLEKILETNKTLWDMDLYGALLYWEPAARSKLIEKLERLTPLTPKLRAVMLAGRPRLTTVKKAELAALERRLGPELQASEFEWGLNLRELTLALLRRGGEGSADGALGLLLDLRLGPEELLETFGTGSPADGAALRAAAEAFLAAPGDAAPARRLAAAAPGNFAYALVLLKTEGFSPAALKTAAEDLRRQPYPLAAGAALYAGRGEKEAALALASEAARLGNLGEAGWQRALLAAQICGAYQDGLGFAARALREHPGAPELLNARGMLKKLSGDAAAARADFEAAAAGGTSFSALMNYAAELEAAGEKARAADAYDRAAAAAPEAAARLAAQAAAARAGSAR